MGTRVRLLVGTRKGGFIFESDGARGAWRVEGPLCAGWPVHDMTYDPTSDTIFAGAGNAWFGPAVFRSPDGGTSWSHSSEGLAYGDDGPKVSTVWSVAPARGSLFAGVDPAGLFRSDDGGSTWTHVQGLTDHPTRPTWQPGAGGLILHTILPHPTEADRMWVAISAVGTFETTDGGTSWMPRNKGVRADFMLEKYPETGQCVHKLVMAAGDPEHLYQQNHCGVYRSFDGGASWQEVTAGLPSEFGFPMVAHPRDPATAWVIPHTGPEHGRFMPDGRAAVWRTVDGGDTWQEQTDGLPGQNAYLTVLRESMASDRLDPVGLYFGTTSGELYGSRDGGQSWSVVAEHLPDIWAVDTITSED
ncbi:MAG TPA: hypothetical protein VIV06_03870 [Candidatus Limnocylindrales bacterium]